MSDAHGAVAPAALVFRRVLRENPSIGREDHALGEAQQHAEDEQHDETGREAADKSRHRPQTGRDRKHSSRREPLTTQPAAG